MGYDTGCFLQSPWEHQAFEHPSIWPFWNLVKKHIRGAFYLYYQNVEADFFSNILIFLIWIHIGYA